MLCVGDIHIKPDNTYLVDMLEKQLHVLIEETQSETVILLGDILHYHEKLHTIALNRACDLIDSLRKKVRVFILVGNHDYIQNAQFLTTNHWMCALKEWYNVTVVDKVVHTCVKNIPILLLPYVPPQRFHEALMTSDLDYKTVKYIFAHQEFKGCKMGALESINGDIWSEDEPQIISGHIHDRQQPQKNIFYVGCSIQNSFGDQTSPIVLELPLWKEHKLSMPKKKTIYVDMNKITPKDILNMDILEQTENQVRVVVQGNSIESFKNWKSGSNYEKLEEKGVKVIFKPDKVSKSTVTTPPQEDNLRSLENEVFKKVLDKRSEILYSIYSKIFLDEDISDENILII